MERRRDLRHGHRGLRHRHDRRPAAAAHRPLPRRALAVGEVRRDGPEAPRPRGVLGLGQPARGQEGARPHDPPGRGLRRQGVQVLQRPLRLRTAVPVAHGRPADRLPGVRARAGARRQPDRRPQGRPARAAADRAHAHVRHGRRGGQLPRHQLRDLPRRAAVARRGAVADRALPEPLRVDRGDGELHRPPAAGVRGDAREDDVVVRGGQDHLRRRVADLAPAVGARGVLELRAPARHRRGARLPAAHRPGQAQDPRREPRASCTGSTSRRRRRSWG